MSRTEILILICDQCGATQVVTRDPYGGWGGWQHYTFGQHMRVLCPACQSVMRYRIDHERASQIAEKVQAEMAEKGDVP